MSQRQASERPFYWLIGALLLFVPVWTIMDALWPGTPRQIWVAFINLIFWPIEWFLDSTPAILFLALVLGVLGLVGVGVLMVVVSGIRSQLG